MKLEILDQAARESFRDIPCIALLFVPWISAEPRSVMVIFIFLVLSPVAEFTQTL